MAASAAGKPPRLLQFGVFEVDLQQAELRKGGRKIKLQDLPFQFLVALLERPGEVVTREELARRLWSGALMDFDSGLNTAARKLRDALDDDAASPRYVETLPRRGYRFIAPVQARNCIWCRFRRYPRLGRLLRRRIRRNRPHPLRRGGFGTSVSWPPPRFCWFGYTR